MLDYRIETFLVLYEEMNYRRAAEKLRMTQPGVTQHIHYLEKHYGGKLFHYDGRALHRTAGAVRLKKLAEHMAVEERAIRESFAPRNTFHLRIGATKTIGDYVMAEDVRRFLEKEDNRLDFTVDNTVHLLAMLEHGEIDFAVVEGVFDKERYGFHLYKREDFVGICAVDHPFAGRSVPLEEAFGECIVVREQGSGTRLLLEQAIAERGYSLGRFRRCAAVSSFSLIGELVARNKAITFAYAPIAASRNDLATFSVEEMTIRGEFNFVYCNEAIAREQIGRFFL